MEVAHNEAVSKLEAERVGAIAAREELSKKVSKQDARGGQNGFDLKKFVKDTNDPKAYAHIEEIVTFTYERYDFHVPKVRISISPQRISFLTSTLALLAHTQSLVSQ